MNVLHLTDLLTSNPDSIIKVLESIGYSNIRYDSRKNSFRFPRRYGGNPTSVILSGENLVFTCFSSNSSGNLFTLVMDQKGFNFPSALQYIGKVAGFESSDLDFECSPPFGGFYRKLQRPNSADQISLPTYSDSILDSYMKCPNKLFIRDGISAKTQEFFNVGYDQETNRITIPQYSTDGKLCGVMGRLNDSTCDHESRWFPLVRCQRSLTLYGYHFNYAHIIQKKTIVIGESEKFVQQCYSFGSKVALATCGCHLSQIQASYLCSLQPKRVILAYDEGLEEEHLRSEAAKLLEKSSSKFPIKVGYVWDSEHEIIPDGSKQNAADLGLFAYKTLLKTKVKYIS